MVQLMSVSSLPLLPGINIIHVCGHSGSANVITLNVVLFYLFIVVVKLKSVSIF